MSNIKKQNTKAVKKDTVAKKTKKTTTAKVATKVSSAKSNEKQAAKKNRNFDLKMAFYLVIAIIVLLIIYFVSFKKPKAPTLTNENNVISEMLSGDTAVNENAYSLNLPSTFKLFRQGNANSSGPATILNVLSFYGKDGVFTEEIVESMKSQHAKYHKGTCVNQFKEIFSTLKFKFYDDSSYQNIPQLQNVEVGLKLIEESVKAGYPVVVGWNKKPGHWSLVVGYDNKSTADSSDDVITMADPDNSKGISNVNASEFDEKWTFGDFFVEDPAAHAKSNKCFLILDKYY